MDKLEALKRAVRELSTEELAEFREWFFRLLETRFRARAGRGSSDRGLAILAELDAAE